MPTSRYRQVLLAFIALCAVGLAGCNVNLTNQSPNYFKKVDSNGYVLSLGVAAGPGATVQAVEVSVNDQWYAMAPTGGGTWVRGHTQPLEPDGHIRGLNVAYRVTYSYAALLVAPTQRTVRLPASGSFQIPILYQDADSDGDFSPAPGPNQSIRGGWDRWDNCVFQPNPDQALGPWYTTSLSFIRLGKLCDPTDAAVGSIDISHSAAPNDILMRDARGHLMLTEGATSYYAFRYLAHAAGPIIPGANGIASLTPGGRVEISDCALVYQDVPGGRTGSGAFMEVYAAAPAHNAEPAQGGEPAIEAEPPRACGFAIKKGGQTLLTGKDVLIMVRSRVDPALPASLHTADMYGRATLIAPGSGDPPDAQALFTALTGQSPVPYIYFINPKLDPLARTGGGPTAQTTASFGGNSYIVFARP